MSKPIGPNTSVGEIFSGINYLEALARVPKEDLVIDLSDSYRSDKSSSGGSLISADVDSIFNKFSIFKYSKFINGAVYQPDAHFIGYASKNKVDPYTDKLNNTIQNDLTAQIRSDQDMAQRAIAENRSPDAINKAINDNLALKDHYALSAKSYAIKNASTLANPTASSIISWASSQSMYSVTGFQPYAMTDFMFCKNYGKIPNNRLITLRRYPFPIDDLIRVPGKKNPVPIAQAVTWFGEGTDNVLSKIGVMNWGLRWETLTVDEPQMIEGNEVTVTDIVNIFSNIKGLEKVGGALEALYVGLNGEDTQLQQLSKQESRLQEYSRKLYTSEGPYWNRLYGPVNVINSSTRRARGMQDGWNSPFTLSFHYSFRSFNGLSPKIVALDLISSFLNLTYNDAQFLGQLARYFPRLGVKFDENMTQTMGKLLTDWGTNFNGDLGEIVHKLSPILNAIKSATQQTVESSQEIFSSALGGDLSKLSAVTAKTLQAGTASLLADAIPKLISIKSALSDRPIGEWHLVVGNPMNPIMVMGDLVCSNCTMQFDEEMGPDDFPTGCTFTVKLAQGKPRDKVSIERMFNLGEAKMMFNKMRNPSSANDTFGEVNNKDWAAVAKGLSTEEQQSIVQTLGTNSFDRYRNRIRKSYRYAAVDGNGKVSGDQSQDGKMDDSLLWLYFDRAADKT
jgi:hypothetical protein